MVKTETCRCCGVCNVAEFWTDGQWSTSGNTAKLCSGCIFDANCKDKHGAYGTYYDNVPPYAIV